MGEAAAPIGWDKAEFDYALERAAEGLIEARGVRLNRSELAGLLVALPPHPDHPGRSHIKSADFVGATLPGTANFETAIFSGDARFSRAQFFGDAEFSEAQFSDRAEFDGAQFSGRADFSAAQFSGDAGFRGAKFSGDARFDGAQLGADFSGAEFLGDARFAGAQFTGPTWFDRAQFSALARFYGAKFSDYASFDGAQFSGEAEFGGGGQRRTEFSGVVVFHEAEFSRDAFFYGAQFSGRAEFNGARFSGRAGFAEAQFSDEAQFGGAKFLGDALIAPEPGDDTLFDVRLPAQVSTSFDGTQFSGRTWFSGAQFSGGARFVRARFSDYAGFDGVQFSGFAGFGRAEFVGIAFFYEAQFSAVAVFYKAQFSGGAGFAEAQFSDEARFDEAQFSGDAEFASAQFSAVWFDEAQFTNVWFTGARFSGDALFVRSVFLERVTLGPLLVSGSLSFDQSNFGQDMQLAASASVLSCCGARFAGTANLDVRWAEVALDDAIFLQPSRLAGAAAFHEVDDSRPSRPDGWRPQLPEFPDRKAQEAGANSIGVGSSDDDAPITVRQGDARPRVVSLRQANVENLALGNVDLRACRFFGAHGLDELRIEAGCEFDKPPDGWRHQTLRGEYVWHYTQRQTLAEEHRWRERHRGGLMVSWYPPECHAPRWLARPEQALGPGQIAPLYRAMRKGLEDLKNEPGAADFYYGEMEMRRHDKESTLSERSIIFLYWLVSGYGLRASRALLALAVTIIALGAIPLTLWGFRPAPPYGRALLFAVQSSISLLRAPTTTPGHETAGGHVIEIFLRLAGPLFFGLALLALRGRVKR